MNILHDSRNTEYRAPYGALQLGLSVTLSLDVWDAPEARVQLRTWIDGKGEGLYPMEAVPGAPVSQAHKAQRYQVAITPAAAGIIWYQFIVDAPGQARRYYGAKEGRFGGIGAARDGRSACAT